MAAPTLPDLKKHLGITVNTDDVEMESVLDAAIGVVEKKVGPLTPTPIVEVHAGVASPVLVLEESPVHEVTSITQGLNAVLADYYAVDLKAGLVQLLGGRHFLGDYTVTYTAGWTTPPAELSLAVLLVGAQLWETQRVPGRTPRFGQGDPAVPAGFAVPRRAVELMAPHRRGPLP